MNKLMFRRICVLIIYVVFCSTSCQNRNKADKSAIILDIPKERFNIDSNLERRDSVFSMPSDSGLFVYASDDYLCLLSLKKKNKPLILEIRSRIGGTLLYDYHSSDDNLLIPLMTYNENILTLHDNLVHKTLCFDIGKQITGADYSPLIKNSNIVSERVMRIGDRLAFLNRNSYEKEPRILFSDKEWNHKEKKKAYNSANVIHGDILYNSSESLFAYVPYNFSCVEILNIKGHPKVYVNFPHSLKQQVGSAMIEGTKMYFCLAPVIECFSAACSGQKYMALGFIDDNQANCLIIMDWDGNILGNIKTHGRIRSLSMSKGGETIYSWERYEGQDVLWTYRFNTNE